MSFQPDIRETIQSIKALTLLHVQLKPFFNAVYESFPVV